MQTRRDQLQAYRFQNRRALAALVTGEPNVIEPPMRRLTVTTVSGIMIAILVAVGFALVGFIKPASGDDWKQSGAIIFDRDTYARYVYIDNVLHPVLNYTSAVLAVGTNQKPHNVMVDSSDLKDAKRGATIGIQGLPDGLPSSSDDLVTSPFAVCSRLQAGSANQLAARVTVQIGDDLGAKRLPGKDAVVVRALGAGSYLLYAGQRLAISPGAVSTALQLDNAASLDVGTAFLDGVPAGPPLRTPTVAHAGEPYRTPIGGRSAVVGQLLDVTADHQFFLVLPDGIAALDPLQTKLLETLRLGAGRQPVTPLPTDESTALALPKSARDWEAVEQQFAGLPQDVPALSDAASQTAGGTGGVCAVYRKTDSPAFEVAPSILPTDSNADVIVTQTPLSRRGLADAVVLDPGKAALVTSNDHSATVFVLADPGRKFPVASTDVLAGFGFADARPVSVSSQLLSLVRKGPPLDPTAARRPVSA